MKQILKKGERVTILPFDKIKLGLDFESNHDKLFFAQEMKCFCGKSYALQSHDRRNVWLLGNGWFWHEDWFLDPFEVFFTDEDFRL